MQTPRVSYIVITMNRRETVLRCLGQLQQQDYDNCQTICVDNGSTDGTRDAVRTMFPDIRLLCSAENLGVAGGRNLGIRNADGTFLIFIDDDAEFEDPAATRRTIEFFSADERIAIVNYTILNANTRDPEQAAIPRANKRHDSSSYQAAYFCGCSFALRRSIVPVVGVFWDRLFYACEELDYSYALLTKNFRIWHARDINVLHQKTPESRPSGQYVYFNARNRLLVAIRWLPAFAALTTVCAWWSVLAVGAVRTGQLRFLFRGIRDGLRLLPEALVLRRPLVRAEFSRLRRLGGRAWY